MVGFWKIKNELSMQIIWLNQEKKTMFSLASRGEGVRVQNGNECVKMCYIIRWPLTRTHILTVQVEVIDRIDWMITQSWVGKKGVRERTQARNDVEFQGQQTVEKIYAHRKEKIRSLLSLSFVFSLATISHSFHQLNRLSTTAANCLRRLQYPSSNDWNSTFLSSSV